MEQQPQLSHVVKPEAREITVAPPSYTVIRVTEGLAFGEGSISGTDEDPKLLALVDDTIHNSPAILTRVDSDDDGCGDGRETVEVYTEETILERTLNRAKVFGGAVVMTAASIIGLGKAGHDKLQTIFATSVAALQAKKINFGAHTAEHVHSPNCGCGAIDCAPEALIAAVKYEEPIRSVISVLGVKDEGVEEVFDNFRTYIREAMPEQTEYSGKSVMDLILSAGKVVARLGGAHKERRIVLNKIRGFTVNQRLIRLVTGGQAQVFGVDVWRLEDIAAKLYPDDPELQHKTFLSELIFTLGVAAVLTKGDLPVDLIEQTVN